MLDKSKELLCSALGLESADSVFPWQEALLKKMLQGNLPDILDIPTGLGKTSVMAIWLVARACGASLPRRLVYVVDRRAVVDQATEVAIALREWIERVIEIKDALGLTDRPLPISTLRGQYADNREWLEDPSKPAIIVGTVDMVGSRLLFEGYGVSRKMRPYHAGLLGVDSLIVLDEAHLAPPFEHLLRAVATDPHFRPRDPGCDSLVPRFRFLSLSATGRTSGGNTMSLTENDLCHHTLCNRLNAKKSLKFVDLDKGSRLEDELSGQAWALAAQGAQDVRVLVYTDSRKVAQGSLKSLGKRAGLSRKSKAPGPNCHTELFVGGRRVFERNKAKCRLEELGFIAGSRKKLDGPAFLFATSAGEVGVDLDADHMVCDLVAWERMVQRFGRVNRRGDAPGHVANVVVIVEPEPEPDRTTQKALDKRARNKKLDEKDCDRIRAFERRVAERATRLSSLKALPLLDDGAYDASVAAVFGLRQRASQQPNLQEILDGATSPEPLRPPLTFPLVESWSLTSLKDHPGRPAVEPWLRGWVVDPPQTAVVWRTCLPVRKGGRAPLKTEIEGFFEAAPPHLSEVLETETFHVVEWLLARVKETVKGGDKGTSEQAVPISDEDCVAFVLNADGTLRQSFTLGDLKETQEKDRLMDSFSNAALIVDSRLRGLQDGLLDPGSEDDPPTADHGDWLGDGVVGFRVRNVDASEPAQRDSDWRERFRFASEVSEDGQPIRWLIVDKWRSDAATEDDRSEGTAVLLAEHQKHAEQRARDLARALGLRPEYEAVLTLAAQLHDQGKASQRWQRAFNAPMGDIYAKTEGPISHRLLDGYRHELGSLLRCQQDSALLSLSPDQRDLVLHLIAAHHGFARPVIPTGSCDDAPPSTLEEKAADIALRFARLQVRWGPWGLAWWEALLRAADQLASR